MMKRLLFLGATLALSPVVLAQETEVLPVGLPDIPFETFTLDNGLTVVVHEDHKAPIVAINLWYHVGSKNEPEGRSGFAHLFEHLMFNGSENFNDDYFQVLERIGATDLNGTTNRDRTNYFQTVPQNAVELGLWMESDRMGHLLGAIDQDKLDEQRGVVQNEKRQGENQPYGQVYNRITNATYPKGHPYAHTVIGSMEDLNAASLDDVYEWFRTYYGPNNAVVAIAGAIDATEAKALAEKYFGDIPPGPPVTHFDAWIAKRTGEQREIMEDRVSQARVTMVWNVPELYSEDYHLLDLAAAVLSVGKTSRFYQRLVYDDQIATDASAFVSGGEIGSQFMIQASAKAGIDLAMVETALREELERFLTEGPTEEELSRVVTQEKANFIRGLERVGGFGGKSDILASGQIYGGTPDAYKKEFHDKDQATPASVREAAVRWLSDGVYILEVHPFPPLSAAAEGAARDALPSVTTAPDAEFPTIHTSTLSNGINVLLVERHAAPLVEVTLKLNAGFAADQTSVPGVAYFTGTMLDEGTATMTALEITDRMANLGMTLGTGSSLDATNVSMSALKDNLQPSFELFADVVLNPSFPETDMERLRQLVLSDIRAQKMNPIQMALRVFPGLLYGSGHAYSAPFQGNGTEETIASLTRDDLVAFHQAWFRPNNATFIVVGDITLDEVAPLLEAHFGSWEAGDIPEKNIATVSQPDKSAIYLLDRPGSDQSVIIAGHLAPPRNTPNNLAIETMNTLLGGAFVSRINMNLREDKGWSYGAGSFIPNARGQRLFLVYAPVQTDKTSESMTEIRQELLGILGDYPPTDDEVLKAQQNLTLTLSGQWETNQAVESEMAAMVEYDLSLDYYDTYAQQVYALDVAQVTQAAHDVVLPNNLIWIVVGDRAVIEDGIRGLDLGEIILIDADGNVLTEDG